MTFLYGQVITKASVSGQGIDIEIPFRYPVANPASNNEGIEQPTEPPIELLCTEWRFTDDENCLVDTESVEWTHYFYGAPVTTATYNEDTEQWEGVEDTYICNNLPVKNRWYYQARCRAKNGECSDWTAVKTIRDNPDPLPTPEITSLKTNNSDQVLVEWTDVSSDIVNFSHYELIAEEINVERRLETDAVIVDSD